MESGGEKNVIGAEATDLICDGDTPPLSKRPKYRDEGLSYC